jgi:succinyl-CoA synthetase alpha subunit
MCILIDKGTKVIVQGITGTVGSFQTKVMIDYGTDVVAGVTPGKGGQTVHGVPVYDLVEEAVEEHGGD